MEALLQCDSAAQFRFWGGEKMAAAGSVLPVRDYREGAVMGVTEVLRKAGTVLRNLSFCKADLAAWKPDAVILIDYPGFNMRVAKYASQHGFKVIWYIAPKVWATRERRVRRLRRWVDRLLVIFPFEQEYFRRRGIDALYVGNPLVDAVTRERPAEEEFADKPYIALLPGSRIMEVEHTMPVFLELEKLMSAGPMSAYQLIVAAAPSIGDEVYDAYLAGSSIKVVRGRTYSVLEHSSAAVIDSGTASLEAALLSVPQVVIYAMNPLSFLAVRMMLKTKYVSLVNLIMDKPVVDELLQKECTAYNILSRLEQLISDAGLRTAMLADYGRLEQMMGGPGASMRAAKEVVDSLKG